MKLQYKYKYGLDNVIYELERVFLKHKGFHGRMYLLWLGLDEYDRECIKSDMREIVREYLFSTEYWRAIAEDVLGNGVIKLESKVYSWLRVHLFHRSHKQVLVFLQDVLTGDKK